MALGIPHAALATCIVCLLPPQVLWTLWFLPVYPTEDHMLEVLRTSGPVRQVVRTYATVIAQLLPFVSPRVWKMWCRSLFFVAQPPLKRRFELNEAPRALQLSYSMILDALFVKAYSPQPSSRDDFARNWRHWFIGDPKKGGFGVKVEAAVSVSNHSRLLWFNLAPAGTTVDARIAEMPGGLFSLASWRNGANRRRDHVSGFGAVSRASASRHALLRGAV